MRIPIATYRLQFCPDFRFRQARDLLAYLQELGISDLYASPVFQARPGSSHGYDVVDHSRLNPELGPPEEFAALAAELRRRRMGWLQDIVPNHMAFARQNRLLTDVLENGPASQYAGFFDIDWNHHPEGDQPRVLAPFLGQFFGRSLEEGELRLDYREEGFGVTYYDLRVPLKIESYLEILDLCLPRLGREVGEEHSDYIQLLGVLYMLRTLRPDTSGNERYEQITLLKKNLWILYRKSPPIRGALERTLKELVGEKDKPESFNRLEQLLSGQWFRLSYWKVACEELNYRRFFCINDLISLRMETPEAFAYAHQLVFRLLEDGPLTGLRIDHIDGLYDPAGYFEQLRERCPDTYLVVEKILAPDEPLPPWPVQGTTGYEFLNQVNGLFCSAGGEKPLTSVYSRFTGKRDDLDELVLEKKRLILERHMAGDIGNLALLLKQLSSRHRHGRDITLHGLRRALVEIMIRLPVYRTYLGQPGTAREFDLRCIGQAVALTVEDNPGLTHDAGFVGRILQLEFEEFIAEEEQAQWLHFVMRFQQFTGPLTAKGFEDTLLYVYNRLISLNEVGGSPERLSVSPEQFHAFCRQRREHWPHALNATATHDTKRGEDLRARLNVLTEIPQQWRQALVSWSRLNRPLKNKLRRRLVPDKNDEYFLYQTLLGAWPDGSEQEPRFSERLRAYLVKAVREAKVHTAWIKPDQAYEDAFVRFAEGLLDPRRSSPFLKEFRPFQRRLAFYGLFNSLGQTLIKITAPGVPDFYQGCELWDLNLVDPDNRRPVDFTTRKAHLAAIREGWHNDPDKLLAELRSDWNNGRIKLFLIHRALQARSRLAKLFNEGEYLPLQAEGEMRDHVLAFARRLGSQWAITVVPRFVTGLVEEGRWPLGPQPWRETNLRLPAAANWSEAITGETLGHTDNLKLGEILRTFPAALLVSDSSLLDLRNE